jgi:glycosyltransferase involved in cell wall biosynthesis
LVKLGVDVHVALPDKKGRFYKDWLQTGAVLHEVQMDLPIRRFWNLPSILSDVRQIVEEIRPDIIHSHFFGTTIVLRLALGKNNNIPRIFQVPGPLHLEHFIFRKLELLTSGPFDTWVASSKYIASLYKSFGIETSRIFLSYYGNRHSDKLAMPGMLRKKFGIPKDQFIVGNINYIYKPKWFLGQTRGLKRHEDVIDALAIACSKNKNVTGILIGGEWGGGNKYFTKLKHRAMSQSDRILMPGYLNSDDVASAWLDFDLAVHVPESENCGGVVEPLLAGVPTIASRVGGLPEVVINGLTGTIVNVGDVSQLASSIELCISRLSEKREQAVTGSNLVREMFDVRRTAKEIFLIYNHILFNDIRPGDFDSNSFALKFNYEHEAAD